MTLPARTLNLRICLLKTAFSMALCGFGGLAVAKNRTPARATPPPGAPEPTQIDFPTLPVAHITRETVGDKPALEYFVSLKLSPVAPSSDRNQFLYLPGKALDSGQVDIEIFSPELPYARFTGATPCSIPSESLPPAPPAEREVADAQQTRNLASTDLERKAKALCDDSLVGFSKAGATKLELVGNRARWEDYVGLPHVNATYLAPNPPIEFASTIETKTLPGPLADAKSLTVPERETKRLARPPVPAGLRNPKTTYFYYERGKAPTYLALLEGEGGLTNDRGELYFGTWRALFFVDGKSVSLLHPPGDGNKLAFVGLFDLSGDGHPDLWLGEPVEMILERADDGFRSWQFAQRTRQ